VADGTGSDRIVNSVASIATRLRDVETIKKVKPNTTPPSGNVSGTLTLLDTPVTVASGSAVAAFTWQTVNVYEYIFGTPKAVWVYFRLRHNATASSASRIDVRRDGFSTTANYTAVRTTSEGGNDATDTGRMFVPMSQSGTFDMQLVITVGTNSCDYDVVLEGFLV
jgi:hypothetical protein